MRRRWTTWALMAGLAIVLAACGTATVLPDGRVLLLEAMGSGRVWDPVAGTITAVGGPLGIRAGSTWTPLNDGRLLIAGGLGADNSLIDTAEIYDPATMSSTATGTMTVPRGLHAAALLDDGRVLLTGGGAVDPGSEAGGTLLSSAEIYDPTSGTFTATGDMTTPRLLHTATRLADGRVLLLGGSDELAGEIYDPGSGTFTATAPLPSPRNFDSVTLLDDGKVLIAGGLAGAATSTTPASVLSSALLYDPATDTFTPTGDLAHGRVLHAAIKLPDGRVLIAGGNGQLVTTGDEDTSIKEAEIYDPATGTFTPTGSLSASRALFGVLLADGRVLMAGASSTPSASGSSSGQPIFTSGEVWDPRTGEWTAVDFTVPA